MGHLFPQFQLGISGMIHVFLPRNSILLKADAVFSSVPSSLGKLKPDGFGSWKYWILYLFHHFKIPRSIGVSSFFTKGFSPLRLFAYFSMSAGDVKMKIITLTSSVCHVRSGRTEGDTEPDKCLGECPADSAISWRHRAECLGQLGHGEGCKLGYTVTYPPHEVAAAVSKDKTPIGEKCEMHSISDSTELKFNWVQVQLVWNSNDFEFKWF